MSTSAPFPSLTKIWHTTPNAVINPTRPELSAKGKVVAITGGGSGIGASIARAFAEAGASGIAIVGRTEKTLQRTKKLIESTIKGASVFAVTGDISNQASIDSAFAAIHERFGEINVFVSNAGYLSEPAPIGEAPVDDWWRSFEVNVKGAFYATQAFLKHGASDATVIGISSAIAHIGPIPGFSGYAASKLAGTKFFGYVQAEYPDLHVVHVQPGVVESTLNIKSKMAAQDDPKLPGDFVVWLTSPEAKFLKGKYAWVNWDVDELKTRAEEIQNSNMLTLTLEGWPFGKDGSIHLQRGK